MRWGAVSLRKRLLDISLGTLLLIGASPLLVGVVLAGQISGLSPALSRQERIELNGKSFGIMKFRMVTDSRFPKVRCARLVSA